VAVTNRRHRLTGYGMAVLYMFTIALHSGLLGALITFARRAWSRARSSLWPGCVKQTGACKPGKEV